MISTYFHKVLVTVSALLCALTVFGATYNGRVVDQNGQAISYATVYPELQPEQGTATNLDGRFTFNTDLPKRSQVVISFVGYEKLSLSLAELEAMSIQRQPLVLKEQPIALQEMVVAAKPSKQRNKRKQMAQLLHAVYVKMQEEFPDQPAQYQVVSDVRMNSNNSTWGMEQMIANIVTIPQQQGRDSVAGIASVSSPRRNELRRIRFWPERRSSALRNRARGNRVIRCAGRSMPWTRVW